MRINWRSVVEWVLIVIGVVAVGAGLLWFENADQEAVKQAAHDFGYNLAGLLFK